LQRFGFPLDNGDGISVIPAPAHDRLYQRQWAQELNGTPNEEFQLAFEDNSERALMKHTGIPLGPEMKLEEHLLRGSNSLLFNGYCLEIVLYSIRISNRGFAYELRLMSLWGRQRPKIQQSSTSG
jgi:hypothetical protein